MGGCSPWQFPITVIPAGEARQEKILEDCGDKKNRNPHVFPIFPVDYPFI
jgi:hypothetical protein